MIIKKIKAKVGKNCRGEDSIYLMVKTSNGKYEASAPSGASVGKYEVCALPKKGIEKAIEFINKNLSDELKNYEMTSFNDFKKIEDIIKKYDETENLEKVGGNTVIALEFALIKALSKGKIWSFLDKNAKQVSRPLGNCVGGGKHINKKSPDIQEFLLVSLDAKNFSEARKASDQIHSLFYKKLKIRNKDFDGSMTCEGGWSPELSNLEVLPLLKECIDEINLKNNFKVRIGLDVAANSLYDGKHYCYKNYSKEQKIKKLTKNEQIKFMKELVEKYNICYLEDPLYEDDFDGFAKLKQEIGKVCLICGDDLVTTNVKRLKKAIEKKSVNSVIVKPNQIGSLIKTKEFIDLAKKNKIVCVMSHRSGATIDATISHLAIGWNCEIAKFGIYGKERKVKLDELEKIEYEIKKKR